ncbi:MAG: hypothetical protein LKG24_02765 [Lacticaseibacillus songhuajiangensis]|jgi:hypothetical protein|nr:hypothetical protein [Lacticaseibacillus songhuajiangensis]
MAHYDGPAFNREGQKPDSPAQKTQEPITYHSVDPMSQFVTPPSVASRTSKAPVINYADITAKMQRPDDAVILIAGADDSAVDKDSAEPVAVTQVETPGATAKAPATTSSAQVDSAHVAKRTPRAVPVEDEWWPVELNAEPVVLRDDSPAEQQHRSTVSALTPNFAPLPDWNVTHDAVAAYLRQKQQ